MTMEALRREITAEVARHSPWLSRSWEVVIANAVLPVIQEHVERITATCRDRESQIRVLCNNWDGDNEEWLRDEILVVLDGRS